MTRILSLLLLLALLAPLAACTAPHDLNGKIDTDLWEVDERPDTEVPNQYPNGRALEPSEEHGVEEGDEH